MDELPRPVPGRRRAISAFALACLGPFVMACSSPAAIVLGFRSLGESAVAGARAPGRATAYAAIVVGALSLWFWGWVVARLAGELSERGKDPAMMIPLIAGLIVVWLVSALAGWLAGRGMRTDPLG
jgi:hypothetical protein